VASPCADADKFSSSFDKKVFFGKLPCKEKKKTLAMMGSVFSFFLAGKLAKQKVFVQGW
jgi:hypothetical protein